MYFVEVILPLSLAKTFTYRVSEAEYNYIKKGCVLGPFGKIKYILRYFRSASK
jgi:primosomal protein N' (replication factor Y)